MIAASRLLLAALLSGTLAAPALAQDNAALARRKADRAWMLKVLPEHQAWQAWIEQTNALPPDYASLPASADLPPLLVKPDGSPITDAADWPARRAELLAVMEKHVWGSPPKEFKPLKITAGEVTRDAGRLQQTFAMTFDEKDPFDIEFTVDRPDKPGKFPTLFLPSKWYFKRGWGFGGAERDYAWVFFPANQRGSRPTDVLSDHYPDATWTQLYRWACTVPLIIDELQAQPWFDTDRVAIGGHSRGAVLAMMAAAIDERIDAVVNSSAGTGYMPIRYVTEIYFAESVMHATGEFYAWTLPQYRWWAGHENYAPFDLHYLPALIAPRPLLNITGVHDWVQGTWPVEQLDTACQPVWSLHDNADAYRRAYRPHNHFWPEDEQPLFGNSLYAWLDQQFDIQREGEQFKAPDWFFETTLHDYDFATWRAASGVGKVRIGPPRTFTPPSKAGEIAAYRADVRTKLAEILGTPNPELIDDIDAPEGRLNLDAGPEQADLDLLNRGGGVKGCDMTKLRFGRDIDAVLFTPEGAKDTGKKIPAIVWCAPQNWATGWGGVYVDWPNAYISLAESDFATLCFDPLGTGMRQMERKGFYDRHPQWSLAGRMVYDVRSAVAALKELPYVDPEQIYLVGYGHGGMVALLAAAMDEDVAGVVSVSGFTPWQTDTAEKPTGGIARYWKLYGTLPMLGIYDGSEASIPLDFDDILATIAPRPTLVVAPTRDMYATHADVIQAVDNAHGVYSLLKAEDKLTLQTPEGFHRFHPERQKQVVQWLKATADR